MKNLHKWFSVFAIFICLISKGQASEIPLIDDQKYFDELKNFKKDSSFDLIIDTLKKIKEGVYLTEIDRNHIKAIPTADLTYFESTISSDNELFDSWVALILFLFPNDSENFNRSLKEAKNKGEKSSITPQAQNNLGLMYRIGKGVDQDLKIALTWFRKASLKNYAPATYNLGIAFEYGQGVDQNLVIAFELYKDVARQGHAAAQASVARMYFNGQGVYKDLIKALKWYKRAALQGYANAQYNVGAMYHDGEGVDKNLDLAFEWLEKSAIQGHAKAQCNLGAMYYKGESVDKNPIQALTWFEKAAFQDHAEAQYNLGVLYRDGHGASKDLKKSFAWYQKAALQGFAIAQFSLGAMYCNGEGTNRNFTKSLKWLLEGYKNSWDDNLRRDCQNAIKKLVTFAPFNITPKDEIDFKTNQDTLKNNLEAFLGLHTLEQLINQPKSSFKEANYAIPSLSQAYDQIVKLEADFLRILVAYNSPGFMVTCLQPNNVDGFSTGRSPDIKYYSYEKTYYLTFGQQNIQAADQLMEIFSDMMMTSLSDIAISELLEIQGQKKRTHQIKALDIQDKLRHKSMSKNRQSKMVKALERQNKSIIKIENNLECLRQLSKIPKQLEDLLIQDAPYRNKFYLKENPDIESLFKD
ncbi:MAG: tetratricopeptide repeat protein [Janthinobacterium lividum]